METLTDTHLLAQIEAFLRETGTAPSRFGLDAMGDGALVRQLRDGSRSLSLRNANRVLDHIAASRRSDAKAA